MTNNEIAAAGPVTANVVPPNKPPATPDTTAVTNPTSAGTPLAKAIANDNGIATHPTVNPAEISVYTVSLLNIFFHSGTKDCRPKTSHDDDNDASALVSSSSPLLLLLLLFIVAAAVEAYADFE